MKTLKHLAFLLPAVIPALLFIAPVAASPKVQASRATKHHRDYSRPLHYVALDRMIRGSAASSTSDANRQAARSTILAQR